MVALGWVLSVVSVSLAQDASSNKTYEQAVAKGVDFLKGKLQAGDGSISGERTPAVTALAVAGILRHGRSPDDPVIAKALKFLESQAQEDGGLYNPKSGWKNYETALIVLALSEANKDGRYKKLIEKAAAFLRNDQWDEGEGKSKADVEYGGAGYGGPNKRRPDLSNTAFSIDALRSAGSPADDESIQRAIVFVSRCQNLESEYNATEFPAKNPDGGFYYTPAEGGNSQAGNTDGGGLRSYASMTYAGLKSMIAAGLKKDDPRVKAAHAWLSKHYDLKQNQGMGDNGLFYYYLTLAKAMDASGEKEIVDAKGEKHDWRKELTAELASRQGSDGSWVNANARWMEGDANLVTAYALLALSHAKPAK
jgi:squalene-hopene/tetraprenyl-beta-curcumene cyclase